MRAQVYASYAARYEGRIVQRMIQNDGGKGDYDEQTPPMLGIWDTLLQVLPSAAAAQSPPSIFCE